MASQLNKLYLALVRDRLLLTLTVMTALLILSLKPSWASVIASVNWPTIVTLSGLLMIARGLEASGLLSHIAQSMMRRVHRERTLALFLVTAAAVLSMVLTNDIALFVVVPLTLGLRQLAVLPIARLIVFEALAVNAGSMLSPIGNPQNILLWQQSGLSFAEFVWQMAPLTGIILVALLLLTAWRFPSTKIALHATGQASVLLRPLAYQCGLLFILFIAAVEYKQAALGLLTVMALLLWRAPRLVIGADWPLIGVFILMFIDIRLIGEIPWLHTWLFSHMQATDISQFWTAAITSQLISNVPSAILLLQFAPPNAAIAFGVNVGGFGWVLGSLANLIALRMSGEKGIWWIFHGYAFPAFFLSLSVATLLLTVQK